jgi:hypothetical protein
VGELTGVVGLAGGVVTVVGEGDVGGVLAGLLGVTD